MNATTPAETEEFDATELGAMMREMRENLGHDLEKVAEDLRIRLVYLEAIEGGRLNDLPGNAYVSGFLRAYSDYLGLDGEEIVRRFKMAGAEISSKTQLHLPSPVEEGRLPTALILLVAAVIAAGAYGGWYYLSSQDSDPMETVAKLPGELSGLVEGAANQTAPTTATAQPETATESAETAPATETPTVEAAEAEGAVSRTASDGEPVQNAVETASVAENQLQTDTSTAAEAASTAVSDATSAPAGSVAPVTAPEAVTEGPETPETQAPAAEPSVSSAATEPIRTEATQPLPQPAQPETPADQTPAQVVETAPQTPSPAPTVRPAPAAATESVAAAQTTPEPEPARTEPEPEAPPQTASVPQPEEPASSRILPGDSSSTVRIVVRATADSYVAVKTADDEPLFSQLMRPGDSYEVPSGADLVLETGNAGGLQITVGGKRVPSLGPVGEVRRNIPLDAERLLRGAN